MTNLGPGVKIGSCKLGAPQSTNEDWERWKKPPYILVNPKCSHQNHCGEVEQVLGEESPVGVSDGQTNGWMLLPFIYKLTTWIDIV